MFERRRAKKRIAAAEALTAATLDGELAHVSGVVRALEMTMFAPTTGRVCVAFACRVFEPSRAEPGGFEPNKPFDCVELVPFAIECELGSLSRITDATVSRRRLRSSAADRLRPRVGASGGRERARVRPASRACADT
jgi:hypothetical protein